MNIGWKKSKKKKRRDSVKLSPKEERNLNDRKKHSNRSNRSSLFRQKSKERSLSRIGMGQKSLSADEQVPYHHGMSVSDTMSLHMISASMVMQRHESQLSGEQPDKSRTSSPQIPLSQTDSLGNGPMAVSSPLPDGTESNNNHNKMGTITLSKDVVSPDSPPLSHPDSLRMSVNPLCVNQTTDLSLIAGLGVNIRSQKVSISENVKMPRTLSDDRSRRSQEFDQSPQPHHESFREVVDRMASAAAKPRPSSAQHSGVKRTASQSMTSRVSGQKQEKRRTKHRRSPQSSSLELDGLVSPRRPVNGRPTPFQQMSLKQPRDQQQKRHSSPTSLIMQDLKHPKLTQHRSHDSPSSINAHSRSLSKSNRDHQRRGSFNLKLRKKSDNVFGSSHHHQPRYHRRESRRDRRDSKREREHSPHKRSASLNRQFSRNRDRSHNPFSPSLARTRSTPRKSPRNQQSDHHRKGGKSPRKSPRYHPHKTSDSVTSPAHSDSYESDSALRFDPDRIWKVKDLIREMVSNQYDTDMVRDALLLCHCSFTDSVALFKALRSFFRMSVSDVASLYFEDADDEKYESKDDRRWLMRQKVTKCINYWITEYWDEDFAANRKLQKEIEHFKSDIRSSIQDPARCSILIESLMDTLNDIAQTFGGINPKCLNVASPKSMSKSDESANGTTTKFVSVSSKNGVVTTTSPPIARSPHSPAVTKGEFESFNVNAMSPLTSTSAASIPSTLTASVKNPFSLGSNGILLDEDEDVVTASEADDGDDDDADSENESDADTMVEVDPSLKEKEQTEALMAQQRPRRSGTMETSSKIMPDISDREEVQSLLKAHQEEKERQRLDELTRTMSTVDMRYPHLIAMNVNIENGNLMERDPEDVAVQLALLDSQVFKKIKKRECLEQRWKKRDKAVRAPGILQMIAQFNDVSKWVQVTIVNIETARGRKRCIKKFISMASYMRDIGDFSSLCAIYNGLSSTNVHQLTASWKLLSKSKRREFEEIKALFGWKMTKLKEMQEELEPPCVPHIGLVLEVLFQIDEGTKSRDEENGSVNYVKMMMMAEQIERLAFWQEERFLDEHEIKIQKLLVREFRRAASLPDDVLYRKAKAIANSEKH